VTSTALPCRASGADDRDVIPQLARPYENLSLYTCGEAYSAQHGWVNGALRSADIVLTTYFGVTAWVADADGGTNPIGR
jgi:hypothetical protein